MSTASRSPSGGGAPRPSAWTQFRAILALAVGIVVAALIFTAKHSGDVAAARKACASVGLTYEYLEQTHGHVGGARCVSADLATSRDVDLRSRDSLTTVGAAFLGAIVGASLAGMATFLATGLIGHVLRRR